MMCDLVFAAPNARFGLPETQLGLLPGAGGTQMLPRAIGKAKAMDLVLTGRLLDAEEAERDGLVSRVAADDVVGEALAAATTIAGRPALAQQLAKESVEAAFETPLQAGIGVERKAFGMAFGSADARDGIAAYLEKRDPAWEQDR
jgi:enoyl-CoA hydratase